MTFALGGRTAGEMAYEKMRDHELRDTTPVGLERLIQIAFGIAASPNCLAGNPNAPVTADRINAIITDLTAGDLGHDVFHVPKQSLEFAKGK